MARVRVIALLLLPWLLSTTLCSGAEQASRVSGSVLSAVASDSEGKLASTNDEGCTEVSVVEAASANALVSSELLFHTQLVVLKDVDNVPPSISQQAPPSHGPPPPRQQPSTPAAHADNLRSPLTADATKHTTKAVKFGRHRHRVPYDMYLAAVLSSEYNAAFVADAALPIGGPNMFGSQPQQLGVNPSKGNSLLYELHLLDSSPCQLPRGGTSPNSAAIASPTDPKSMPVEAIPVPWVLADIICLLGDRPADNTTTSDAAVMPLTRSILGTQQEAAFTAAASSAALSVAMASVQVCLPEQQPGGNTTTTSIHPHAALASSGSTSGTQPHDASTHVMDVSQGSTLITQPEDAASHAAFAVSEFTSGTQSEFAATQAAVASQGSTSSSESTGASHHAAAALEEATSASQPDNATSHGHLPSPTLPEAKVATEVSAQVNSPLVVTVVVSLAELGVPNSTSASVSGPGAKLELVQDLQPAAANQSAQPMQPSSQETAASPTENGFPLSTTLVLIGAVVCLILTYYCLWLRMESMEHVWLEPSLRVFHVESELKNCKRALAHHVKITTELVGFYGKLLSGQQLLRTQHARSSSQHRAVKSALASLKKQQGKARKHQAQARKQRLALRRSCMWATARSNTLEQRIAALQQALANLLAARQEVQHVKTTQSNELDTLKRQISQLQGQTQAMALLEGKTLEMETRLTGQVQGLQGECAALKAQLTNQQRAKELLDSQSAVIADLRAQLSAGQQEQQQLASHLALLQNADAQGPAHHVLSTTAVDMPLGPLKVHQQKADVSEDYKAACLSAAAWASPTSPPTSPKVAAGRRQDHRGDYLPSAVERSDTSFLSTHAVDHRGDYLPEAVERSASSYLSPRAVDRSSGVRPMSTQAVDRSGLVRVSTGSIPASRGGSWSGGALKPRAFEGHSNVFDRLQMGLEMGSPKGKRQGNPFADSFTGKLEAAPAAVDLAEATPAAAVNLAEATPAVAVDLAAASATTVHSTVPLLPRSESQDSEIAPDTTSPNTQLQKVRKTGSVKGFLKRIVSGKKAKV